ncbi:class I SAM-dependent methyltransferase [Oceanibacterium hippocampi]|uniref:Methyltransferase domain-containing protein n=1 Tax=Oceanibacterium hippocampi TaxID=745714 RepID=A0A1Y5SQU9_9PROT|nr:class I SAM-dependent methyltransferase [Oceanibacterium hippocampi]SLN44503.1 hypothetical protein OCH7691_01884 [Oceanibacterium hippocampi]
MLAARAPLVRAMIAQLLALSVPIANRDFAPLAGIGLPFWQVVVLQGAVAALLGLAFGLRWWWLPIQLALPAALFAARDLGLPPWLYLAVFALLLLFYWNSARGQVPLYLTNRATRVALAGLLEGRERGAFVDLGCGFGGTVIALARHFPEGRFCGVESAPMPWLVARLRAALSGCGNVRIVRGDLWRHDLSGYDCVYCFLSPVPMARLFAKAEAELAPGALFVSNSFEVPDRAPERIVEVGDRRGTRLLVWHPGRATG